MKVHVTENIKKIPTFGELKQGELFIPMDENYVHLKAKYKINGKIKAVRLEDGFITDMDDTTRVIPCHGAELYVKI